MHPRLKRGNRLPSLPTVAVEILRLFNSPDSSIKELTDTIQTDPAMATRILKAANSPRYCGRGEITDLRMAITRLGRNHITPLALSFSLASPSLESNEAAEHYKQIWLRSFVQATAAEIVAGSGGPAAAAECFTTNLLAGIGRLAMLKADVELYGQCLEQSNGASQAFSDAAGKLYGICPVALAVDILDDIGLPERCIEAVRQLDESAEEPSAEDNQHLISVTHIADAVARYLCDDDSGMGLLALEESIADVKDQTIESLLDEIHSRLEESASLFNVDPSQIPAQDELLDSALQQLADFTSLIGTANQDQVPSELLEENGRLKRRVQDLMRETSIDTLTGLYNRNWFNTHLAEVQAISRIHNQEFGIAVIDIDHFKMVNDTWGHQAGDYVLQEVAKVLKNVTRQNETVARFGGEEFVLLLEDTHRNGMQIVGERLRKRVEDAVIEFGGTAIPVTVSVGLAHGHPTENDSFKEELFARADAALYEAKHNGRNQVVLDQLGVEAAGELTQRPPAPSRVASER